MVVGLRCECDACSEPTTCDLCRLSVMRGSLSDHQFVCSRRAKEELPQSLHSRHVTLSKISCFLVATRKLGCRDPYTKLLFNFCVGNDTWTYGDAICLHCDPGQQVHLPLFLIQQHFYDHHQEVICEVCGLVSTIVGLINHDCSYQREWQTWRQDYEIICPSGCGQTLLKSAFPHRDCPHLLKRIPLMGLPGLGQHIFHNASYYDEEEVEGLGTNIFSF